MENKPTLADIKEGKVDGVTLVDKTEQHNASHEYVKKTRDAINSAIEKSVNLNIKNIYDRSYGVENFYDDEFLKTAKETDLSHIDLSNVKDMEIILSDPFASFKTTSRIGLRIKFFSNDEFNIREEWFFDPYMCIRQSKFNDIFGD
jgi:hypothetical protein